VASNGPVAKIIIWFVRIADIFYFCGRENFGFAGLHSLYFGMRIAGRIYREENIHLTKNIEIK
jgi:hypothetical protein